MSTAPVTTRLISCGSTRCSALWSTCTTGTTPGGGTPACAATEAPAARALSPCPRCATTCVELGGGDVNAVVDREADNGGTGGGARPISSWSRCSGPELARVLTSQEARFNTSGRLWSSRGEWGRAASVAVAPTASGRGRGVAPRRPFAWSIAPSPRSRPL
jgi:hypothetical protein